jgi:hypothetical protein
MWVSSYGHEAEILEPRDYRDVIQEKLERWRGMYG